MRGNDFLVSLGAFSGETGTIKDQAATFMHELGHNLGLRHAGDRDNPNYKPNYVSIMNYLFQFDIRVPDRAIDFSTGDKSILRESSLDENIGIGDLVKTAWWLPNGTLARSVGALPIDWNGDGSITANVKVNLNNIPQHPVQTMMKYLQTSMIGQIYFIVSEVPQLLLSGAQAESHEELNF